MSWKNIVTVYRKELIDTLRDRRALMSMIIIPTIVMPGLMFGVGKIAASSLEQSNVELADQLTDMIVAQRAYQANTKVISTTDQLLSQLNDILR